MGRKSFLEEGGTVVLERTRKFTGHSALMQMVGGYFLAFWPALFVAAGSAASASALSALVAGQAVLCTVLACCLGNPSLQIFLTTQMHKPV